MPSGEVVSPPRSDAFAAIGASARAPAAAASTHSRKARRPKSSSLVVGSPGVRDECDCCCHCVVMFVISQLGAAWPLVRTLVLLQQIKVSDSLLRTRLQKKPSD